MGEFMDEVRHRAAGTQRCKWCGKKIRPVSGGQWKYAGWGLESGRPYFCKPAPTRDREHLPKEA
jgi:hypothetical protein